MHRREMIVLALLALAAPGCKQGTQRQGGSGMKGNQFGFTMDDDTPPGGAAKAERPRATVPQAGPAAAAWARVKEEVLRPARCYAGQAEYCVRDPAVVDPILLKAIDQYHGGVLPETEAGLKDLAFQASTDYGNYQQSPEGLRRIEQLVQERYDHPVITEGEGGKEVTADFGVLPGPLTTYRGIINTAGSPLREDSQWKSTEVGQKLKALSERYPRAQRLRLLISVPSGTGQRRWQYGYDRQDDRVTVQSTEAGAVTYASAPLGHGFDAVIRGERSLLTSQLKPLR